MTLPPQSPIPNPQPLKLLVLDVDGVLTDGIVAYTETGDELKHFHIRDGLGIVAALRAGLTIAVITSRTSTLVERRMRELGVRHLEQNCKNKAAALTRLSDQLNIPLAEVGYVGDDLVDLAAMKMVGYPIAVADAAPELLAVAAYVTTLPGGRGAVREAIEYILKAQGKWAAVVAEYAGLP